MDIAGLDIFKGNPTVFNIAAFFVLLGAAVKTVTGLLNFHEEFLVRRYVKRLDSLSKDIDADSTTDNYIKVTIQTPSPNFDSQDE